MSKLEKVNCRLKGRSTKSGERGEERQEMDRRGRGGGNGERNGAMQGGEG